jgi:hypothetical protein
MGVAGTVNLTDSQVSRRVLEQNPYLARQVCYVAECAGIDTYIVRPRDRHDISLLVETQRSNPSPGDVDLLAGMRGPVAPPYMCNGLTIPIVEPYAIYSFTRQSLIDQIPQPEGIEAERFRASAEGLFDMVMGMADNAGSMEGHRALNFLLVRYARIYTAVAEAHGRNLSLTAVDTRPSPLSGVRKIMRVVFSFTHRTTGVLEQHYAEVDVQEPFHFLVSPLRLYIERS